MLWLAFPALAKGKSDPDAEKEVIRLEQDWANAFVKGDAVKLAEIEADDYIYTGPDGKVTTKAEEQRLIKSGDLKFTECRLTDLKVRIYGKTAVVSGISLVKGTEKQHEVSGKYRFTDVWIHKKNGWKAVASHEVSLAPEK